jgi:hypothetical protein
LQNLPAMQSSSGRSSGLQNLVQQLQSRQNGAAGASSIPFSPGTPSAQSSGSSTAAPLPLPIPVAGPAFGAPPANGAGAAAVQSAVAQPNPAELPVASQSPAFQPPAVVQQAQQPIDDAGSNNAALALALEGLSDEELLILLAALRARLERNNPPAAPPGVDAPSSSPSTPTAETRLTSIPDTDDFAPSTNNSRLPIPQTSYQRAQQIAHENGGRVVTRVENGVTYHDVLVNR